MPTVSPWSEPGARRPGHRAPHVPACTSRSSVMILRFQAKSSASAWLATSRIQMSGMFTTITPSSVAAGTSMTS